MTDIATRNGFERATLPASTGFLAGVRERAFEEFVTLPTPVTG